MNLLSLCRSMATRRVPTGRDGTRLARKHRWADMSVALLAGGLACLISSATGPAQAQQTLTLRDTGLGTTPEASAPALLPPMPVGASLQAQTPAKTARTKKAAPPAKAVAVTDEDGDAPQRLVWDKAPLQVVIGVGAERERRITFPSQMFIGVPQEIAQLLRIQTVDRTSYLTAIAPFPKTRVMAEDRVKGTVVLLDLQAVSGPASTGPISVVTAGAARIAAADAPRKRGAATPEDDAVEDGPPIDFVTLTRFAAKQLYAPRRLATPVSGIRRVPVNESSIAGLYRGALLRATPIASWRGDDLYVTAVLMQNDADVAIDLNPLEVRGAWRAITFQHARLQRKGTDADTTVAYLICERPFEACR